MYVCETLSEQAVCLSWIPFQPPIDAPDFSLLNEAFLQGFGIIFGIWSLGFAIGVTVKLVRLA